MRIPLRLLVILWGGVLLSFSLHAKDDDAAACAQGIKEAAKHRNEGDFNGAVKLATQALNGPCAHLSPDHAEPGFAFMVIGTAKMDLHDWAGAEPALTAALANFERNLGPSHKVTAGTLNDVGIYYGQMGYYTKAKELLLRAIASYREIDDRTLDVRLARSYSNLGNAEIGLDHYPAAEEALRAALVLRGKVLGPEDRDTIESLVSLGHVLLDQDKCAAAKREFELALARSEKVFGPNDPLTGDALNGIGKAQLALGKVDEAEELFRRSLAIAEKSSASDPIDRASRLHNLGSVEYARHRYTEAETLLLKALTIFEKAAGTAHPDLLKTVDDLAKVNKKLNKSERAATFEARARQIREKMR